MLLCTISSSGLAGLDTSVVRGGLNYMGVLGCEVPLRERLRTQKVFQKDPCFYLNYHKFSIKSYVLDVY